MRYTIIAFLSCLIFQYVSARPALSLFPQNHQWQVKSSKSRTTRLLQSEPPHNATMVNIIRPQWPPDNQWPLTELVQGNILKFEFRFQRPGPNTDEEESDIGYIALNKFGSIWSPRTPVPRILDYRYPPGPWATAPDGPWVFLHLLMYPWKEGNPHLDPYFVFRELLPLFLVAMKNRPTRSLEIMVRTNFGTRWYPTALFSLQHYFSPSLAPKKVPELPFSMRFPGVARSLGGLTFIENPRSNPPQFGPAYGRHELSQTLLRTFHEMPRRSDFATVPFRTFHVEATDTGWALVLAITSMDFDHQLFRTTVLTLLQAFRQYGVWSSIVEVWEFGLLRGRIQIYK